LSDDVNEFIDRIRIWNRIANEVFSNVINVAWGEDEEKGATKALGRKVHSS